MLRVSLSCLLALSLSGCASVFMGTQETITVTSQPPGARIYVNGFGHGYTPNTFSVPRKNDVTVELVLFGYERATATLTSAHAADATAMSILLGGAIGYGIDAASGADKKLTSKTIDVVLTPKK
jgi:hypothetical protein